MPKAFILLLNRTILSQAHLSLESSSTRAQKKPKEFNSGFAFAIKSLKFNPISVHSDRNFQLGALLDSPNFNAPAIWEAYSSLVFWQIPTEKFIHSLQKIFTICAWIVHRPFMIPSRISHESVMNRSLNMPIFLSASLTHFLTISSDRFLVLQIHSIWPFILGCKKEPDSSAWFRFSIQFYSSEFCMVLKYKRINCFPSFM